MTNVLMGYNPLTDRVTPSCVAPEGDPSYVAGQSSETLDLVYLENRATITEEISDALGLGLGLFGLGVDGAYNVLRSVSTKSTSINLLVRMSADYWVMNRRALTLEDWAAAKIVAGISPFVKACGTHYADGVRFGGYVYALITMDASDTTTIESVKESLGLSLFGLVPLTPTLEHKVESAATHTNVAVTVHFAADGFLLDGKPASAPILATLLGEGIGSEFFQVLDHIREQLEQSVVRDMCRDGGIGDCDGAPAPGYANNTFRNARPTGIYVGYYDRLSNGVPAGTETRYEEIYQRLDQTEIYVRGLRNLEARIDNVYGNEIGKVLAEDDEWGWLYQVAPPAQPLVRPSDLTAIAETWGEAFTPGGPARQPIQDALLGCQQASTDLSDCMAGVAIEDTPAFQEVNAQLNSYAMTGRVLNIRWKAIIPEVSEKDRWNACPGDSRLPTVYEARFLSPVIGYSEACSGQHSTWIGGETCGYDDNAAYRVNPQSGTVGELECLSDSWFFYEYRCAVCVPLDGPFPKVDPP